MIAKPTKATCTSGMAWSISFSRLLWNRFLHTEAFLHCFNKCNTPHFVQWQLWRTKPKHSPCFLPCGYILCKMQDSRIPLLTTSSWSRGIHIYPMTEILASLRAITVAYSRYTLHLIGLMSSERLDELTHLRLCRCDRISWISKRSLDV